MSKKALKVLVKQGILSLSQRRPPKPELHKAFQVLVKAVIEGQKSHSKFQRSYYFIGKEIFEPSTDLLE